jgi:hypothetical protein
MGPSLDCVLRRSRLPAVDLEKEALRQPKLTKRKVRDEGGTAFERIHAVLVA